MEWRADIRSNIPQQASAGAQALRDEGAAARELAGAVRDAARAIEGMASAQREAAAAKPAFSQANEQDFQRSKWEKPPPPVEDQKKAPKDARDPSRDADAAQKRGKAEKSAALEAAAGVKEGAKALALYGAAMAGLHSARDLTEMAIGWRGMAQLQMTSWKATMDLRRAVSGVDAQPLVRATTALERNLSKSTVTGNALSGILTRGFNAAFSAIERLEPVAEGAFQALVLGGIEAEIAWQKSKAALAPVIVLVEDAADRVDGMGEAAKLAATGFEAVATVVEKIASAISTAVTGMDSLVKKAVRFGYGTDDLKARGEQEDREKTEREKAERPSKDREVFKIEGGRAKRDDIIDETEGVEVGKSITDGMVKGLKAGTPAVRAAGNAAGREAVAGAREGADAHSPSRATERLGGDLDEGAIRGMEKGAGRVARTAARVLAPEVEPKPAQGGAAPVPAPVPSIGQIGPFHFGDSVPQDLRQRAEEAVREGVRAALIRLGIPIPGGA